MPRDVFPYAEDRIVIQHFLNGVAYVGREAEVSLSDHKLYAGSHAIAWFDSAGALTIMLGRGHAFDPGRIVDFICDELGIPEMKLRREVECLSAFGSRDRVAYYTDDRAVRANEPYVLAGPLTMQAYRAERMSGANPRMV